MVDENKNKNISFTPIYRTIEEYREEYGTYEYIMTYNNKDYLVWRSRVSSAVEVDEYFGDKVMDFKTWTEDRSGIKQKEDIDFVLAYLKIQDML